VKLLALDTATENCSAALLIDEHLSARERLLERGHAQQILPMIDELLRAANVTLAQLDAIAFGRGPGAFTGVRLAASITQGLAFGAGVPVVPVSDLRALAQQAMTAPARCERVLACLDARMQEVYFACFERAPTGVAMPVGEERVAAPRSVCLPEVWISPGYAAGPKAPALCGAGPGFVAYPDLISRLGSEFPQVHGELRPRAQEIARLAVPEILAGRVFQPEQALPVYLRNDVTQSQRPSH
jgi:tRNA threonylcarbamoyladenosine biosynthesis protein TsaB